MIPLWLFVVIVICTATGFAIGYVEGKKNCKKYF